MNGQLPKTWSVLKYPSKLPVSATNQRAMNYRLLVSYLVLSLTIMPLSAQDPQRFAEEVEQISIKYDTLWDSNRETIVFTGSSSIRLWEGLEKSFPDHQIVNSGFGGSFTTDLLEYIEPLVLRFKPKMVFIYEGDNDVEGGVRPNKILRSTHEVISQIRQQGYAEAIVIISAKPSLERWHLRRKYRRLNRKYAKLCEKDSLLKFADIWNPMLNGKKLKKDLFIEDGLHMNNKGYTIWYEVLKNYVDP